MTKKFDVSAKATIDPDPAFFLRLAGFEVSGTVTEVNSDLSSVTREADRIYRLENPQPWIAHFEILADPDSDIPEREDCYNALTRQKHKLSVLSAIVLLAPKADHPALTGTWESRLPNGFVSRVFRYIVIRLWEIPYAEFLRGPVELLPFALLSKFDEASLPLVMHDIQDRLAHETTPAVSERMLTTTRILMGLRFPIEVINSMFLPLDRLKSSVTYQEILQRGEVLGEARGEARGEAKGEILGRIASARKILISLGTRHWGHPPEQILTQIDGITNPDLMEHLAESVLDMAGWDQLVDQLR